MSAGRYLLHKHIQSRISHIQNELLKTYKEGRVDNDPYVLTLQGALNELREIERMCEERGRY